VSRNASDSEIKRAYHRLAKEFHPDKNPAAGDRFKEISYAYDVLSDQKKRDVYDRFGIKGLQEGGGHDGDHFGFGNDIFSDLFGQHAGMFFGGGGGHGHHGHSRGRRGEDNVKPLKVTLEDLYNGKTHTVKLHRKAICKDCQGTGTPNAKASRTCSDCRGSGVKMQYRQLGPGLVQQIHSVCSKCAGQGSTIPEKDRCKTCEGKKIIQETKDVEVHVDKGMSHGMKITMQGQGDEEPGTTPGDLIYVLQQEAHEDFERSGDNLITTHTLSLTEALCGFQFIVRHLDGRSLVVGKPAGQVVPSDSVHIVEDEGMPHYKRPFEKGNLLIKFKVEFPVNHFTDEKSLQLLETLLPPRPEFVKPTGDNVEEADLNDYEPSDNNAAQDSDDDDDTRGPRVGCAQQ
jgi:DnaJ family protein A protein 2